MEKKFPPLLITFEGIDGSGKSTQAALLVQRLRSTGADPLAVREPGGTAVSEAIRQILLDARSIVSPRSEMLLFAAARAQLVEEVIRPTLETGRPVICDRFYDSTTAYQGGGRGIAAAGWLAEFHRFTTGGLIPHRTYLVDVPLEVAAQRRGDSNDRMEAAGDPFFRRVREAYRHLAETDPSRFLVLDGTHPVDALHDEVWADVQDLTGTGPKTSG